MGKSRVFHGFRLEQDMTSREANQILSYLRDPEMRAIEPPKPFKDLYSALVEIAKGCAGEDGLADPAPAIIGLSFESRTGLDPQRTAALTKPVDPVEVARKQPPVTSKDDDEFDEED